MWFKELPLKIFFLQSMLGGSPVLLRKSTRPLYPPPSNFLFLSHWSREGQWQGTTPSEGWRGPALVGSQQALCSQSKPTCRLPTEARIWQLDTWVWSHGYLSNCMTSGITLTPAPQFPWLWMERMARSFPTFTAGWCGPNIKNQGKQHSLL